VKPLLSRTFPLEDIAIRADGTGRTVTAYAAVFGSPYEVSDFDGHYYETIHRAAFNRTLSHGVRRAQCLFNHGMTLQHTPSERYAMPLGRPMEIRSDSRGLLTVTEYAKTPLADEVLELIRSGSITAQSFRGPINASRDIGRHLGLPHIERTELGLIEYGPCTLPVNEAATIVGVRSHMIAEQLRELSDGERAELLAEFGTQPQPAPGAPADGPPSPEDTPPEPANEAPPTGPSLDVIESELALRRRRAGLEPLETT